MRIAKRISGIPKMAAKKISVSSLSKILPHDDTNKSIITRTRARVQDFLSSLLPYVTVVRLDVRIHGNAPTADGFGFA